jgi:hypothetical protein
MKKTKFYRKYENKILLPNFGLDNYYQIIPIVLDDAR